MIAETPPITVAHGRYLTNIAECGVCHGSKFAGGRSFHDPPGPTSAG
ncbi:hypothetical protein MJD09_20680 [bacterium]|nr:hypothetical protein [bacterium]